MSTSMMAAASGGPFLAIGSNGDGSSIGLLFFLSGFLFYGLMYLRYRNVDKRHMHARETEAEIDNVRAADDFVGRRTRQRNRRIAGANERHVEGAQNGGLGAAGLLNSTSGHSVRNILNAFDKR
ncbi:hypothetical protein [Pseudactinotalea sp. Z1732]|uniref:hypothetical protein n=1 Tax=Pseudactinotalea sp. Z1732 TaxID=3413026 RepID=UPI003C7DD136